MNRLISASSSRRYAAGSGVTKLLIFSAIVVFGSTRPETRSIALDPARLPMPKPVPDTKPRSSAVSMSGKPIATFNAVALMPG